MNCDSEVVLSIFIAWLNLTPNAVKKNIGPSHGLLWLNSLSEILNHKGQCLQTDNTKLMPNSVVYQDIVTWKIFPFKLAPSLWNKNILQYGLFNWKGGGIWIIDIKAILYVWMWLFGVCIGLPSSGMRLLLSCRWGSIVQKWRLFVAYMVSFFSIFSGNRKAHLMDCFSCNEIFWIIVSISSVSLEDKKGVRPWLGRNADSLVLQISLRIICNN